MARINDVIILMILIGLVGLGSTAILSDTSVRYGATVDQNISSLNRIDRINEKILNMSETVEGTFSDEKSTELFYNPIIAALQSAMYVLSTFIDIAIDMMTGMVFIPSEFGLISPEVNAIIVAMLFITVIFMAVGYMLNRGDV